MIQILMVQATNFETRCLTEHGELGVFIGGFESAEIWAQHFSSPEKKSSM